MMRSTILKRIIYLVLWLMGALLTCVPPIQAGIFGTVRGIVHDPRHHPVAGAEIVLRAQGTDWQQEIETDADGGFSFAAVPAGIYKLQIAKEGFHSAELDIVVNSGSAPILHIALAIGAVAQTIEVSAGLGPVDTESSTTQSTIGRSAIERAPGNSRTNSLQMITNFVPGAYMVHDQLHIRGGHQVSWMVDGVPVPNNNISGNVGPQFDPKDIDTLEVKRGGYSAEYGDRTFGVFNVIPRSGFERNHEGEVVTSFGSFNETNDQVNFGDHTNRFAYYASVNGNRTDLGLETPVPQVVHDLGSGVGGFASLIFNASPADQLRLVTSLRRDYFQIPKSANSTDTTRDVQNERDAFVNFSWVRTLGSGMLLTVSPFYHFNRANLDGGANDPAPVTTDHRSSLYAGGQITFAVAQGRHNARLGFYSYAQQEDDFFRVQENSPGGSSLSKTLKPGGQLEALFLEDQVKLSRWLTVSAGTRLTHFSGGVDENAADPRLGATISVPRIHWVVRASYGRTYQAPPLSTIFGPLLNTALTQGFRFLPLRGERDEQYEIGIAIPLRGWVVDTDYFHTRARNFFDHTPLGNSNIFLPVTIETARLRGWETTVRSPQLYRRAQFHLAYSHQFAEGRGGVSGGLTSSQPPAKDFFFLDHDQRETLAFGGYVELPWRSWAAASVNYGSGFVQGNGPAHKPGHTTFDVSMGKALGEAWSVSITALNVNSTHFLLDESNTFGGTHFNNPRQISGEVRYRFHF